MFEENKTGVRRSIEEVWTKGNLSVADELFSENYRNHDPSTPDFGPGPEGEKKRATLYRTAFPDLRLSIDELIAEGDIVSCRWTSVGTHRGPLPGIPPTGKTVSVSGMTFSRLAGGKIVEAWANWDTLTLLQELGVVPVILKELPDDHRPHVKWNTQHT